MDLADAQIEVDVVVGDHAGEPLDDPSHLDREGGVVHRQEAREPREPVDAAIPEVRSIGLR